MGTQGYESGQMVAFYSTSDAASESPYYFLSYCPGRSAEILFGFGRRSRPLRFVRWWPFADGREIHIAIQPADGGAVQDAVKRPGAVDPPFADFEPRAEASAHSLPCIGVVGWFFAASHGKALARLQVQRKMVLLARLHILVHVGEVVVDPFERIGKIGDGGISGGGEPDRPAHNLLRSHAESDMAGIFFAAAALCRLWGRGLARRDDGSRELPELLFQHRGEAAPSFCGFRFLPGDFAISPACHRSRSGSMLLPGLVSFVLLRRSWSAWFQTCLSISRKRSFSESRSAVTLI